MSKQPPPYSPPPPGFNDQNYPPPPPGHGNIHMGPLPTAPNVVVQHASFGPDPQATICPSCHAQIVTKVESKANSRTHMFALLLCCFICWPCAWIPYVMDSCQSQTHYCPNCNAYIGVYEN